MHLILRVIAPCVHDATFYDRCNTCRIALFPTVLAIISLVIGHIVGLVGTGELDYVSSWASNRRR